MPPPPDRVKMCHYLRHTLYERQSLSNYNVKNIEHRAIFHDISIFDLAVYISILIINFQANTILTWI